jgi:hypothetical protein
MRNKDRINELRRQQRIVMKPDPVPSRSGWMPMDDPSELEVGDMVRSTRGPARTWLVFAKATNGVLMHPVSSLTTGHTDMEWRRTPNAGGEA